jgi:hypothetical protein
MYMKYLIVKQLSIDNHFLWDIWFQGLLSVYKKKNSHRALAKMTSIQKLINIDRRKLVEILVLILKK